MQAVWQEAPTGTCCIVGLHCVVSLSSLALPAIARACSLTVDGIWLGRVLAVPGFWLLSPLGLGGNTGLGVLMFVISMLVSLSLFPRVEQEHGTLRFLLWVLVYATTIALVFLVVMLTMGYLLNPVWSMTPCLGLWPLLVVAMTTRSMAQPPDSAVSLWGLLQIPSRWYPLAMVLLFTVLSMSPQVDLIAAWVIAVASHHAGGSGPPLHPKLAWVKLPLHHLLPASAKIIAFESGEGSWGGGQTVGGGAAKSAGMCSKFSDCLRATGKKFPKILQQRYISASATGYTPVEGGPAPATVGASGNDFRAFGGAGNRLGEV